MKIYNVTNIPEGLGYKADYEKIYQQGYEDGFREGYDSYICPQEPVAEEITITLPDTIVGSATTIVEVFPSDATVELEYTSSDPSVATVDENGNVTAVSDGEATICVFDNISELEDCITVSVEVPVLSISPIWFEDIPYSGATYAINVTANQPWRIINFFRDILTTDITGGTGNGVIHVTVAPSGEGGVIADLIIRPAFGSEVSAHFWQLPTPFLRVSPLSISSPASGGTYSIRLESNYDWEATNIPDWVSLSRTSGHSNADISAVVSANGTTSARTASIVFSHTETGATGECTVVITQDRTGQITVTPERIEEETGTGGTFTIDIEAGGAWHLWFDNDSSWSPDWVSFDVSAGTGSASVQVTLDMTSPYPGESDRTGMLNVISDGDEGNANVYVRQVLRRPVITVSPTYIYDSTGTGLSETVWIGKEYSDFPSWDTWSATTDASWISLSPSSGAVEYDNLIVTLAPNSPESNRSGEITITESVYGDTITIVVDQNDAPEPEDDGGEA